MSNIVLPDVGELVYEKVYMEIDKPLIFKCHFSNEPNKIYVGIHVEEFEAREWLNCDIMINNYWLTAVTSNQLKLLEMGTLTLKEVFDHSMVLFISHRYSAENDHYATIFRNYKAINPTYHIADSATLVN